MGYEIPQELAYKERIIFGLTLMQVGYALFFCSFIFVVVLVMEWSVYVKLSVSVVLLGMGLACMFFRVVSWAWRFLVWCWLRRLSSSSGRMKRLLGVRSIKENVVVLRSGVCVAIVEVVPKDISLLGDDELRGVELGFQRFLNGVDFSLQFVVSTTDVRVDKQLQGLTGTGIDRSFFDFLRGVFVERRVKNRRFFVVVQGDVQEVELRVGVTMDNLRELGVFSRRVCGEVLMDLLAYFCNGVHAGQKTAEELNASPAHELVSPSCIVSSMHSLRVNDRFCKVVSVSGYPRRVSFGFLDKLIRGNEDFDVSMFVVPFDVGSTSVLLNSELEKQRADLFWLRSQNMLNSVLEMKYRDTRQVLEAVQKGEEKMFLVSVHILCRAESELELARVVRRVESVLHSLLIVPVGNVLRQVQAFASVLPLGRDMVGEGRNITTRALGAFYPFTSEFLRVQQDGIFLGLNRNNLPVVRDVFSLSNANGTILASSGGGKSYFAKLMIARYAAQGTKVLIVDPQGEYVSLVRELGGEVIMISKDSLTVINPLDLMGQDYVSKRLSLMSLFKVMIEDVSEAQLALLDKAVTAVYNRCGILRSDEQSWSRAPPVLADLEAELVSCGGGASSVERSSVRALLNRVSMYTSGVFSFLNRQTKIDFSKDVICFDIGSMPKQVTPVMMFLILEYVYAKMKRDRERKLLVIDEAWSLLRRTSESSYVFEIVKTCRKFNLGLLLITQDVEDLLSSHAGKATLNNSSYTLLLRQKPTSIRQVGEHFHLSSKEKEVLLSSRVGRGMLILENERQELEIIASPEEHKVVTTNPNENLQVIKKDKGVVGNHLPDLSQGLYRVDYLSKYHINYLQENGYIVTENVPLGEVRPRKFLLKPVANESAEHTFLVQEIVAYVRKLVCEVVVRRTTEADIVLTLRDGRAFAIEVETGTQWRSNKKVLENKVVALNEKYGKNWCFVLTATKNIQTYRQLGQSIGRNNVLSFLDSVITDKKDLTI